MAAGSRMGRRFPNCDLRQKIKLTTPDILLGRAVAWEPNPQAGGLRIQVNLSTFWNGTSGPLGPRWTEVSVYCMER